MRARMPHCELKWEIPAECNELGIELGLEARKGVADSLGIYDFYVCDRMRVQFGDITIKEAI